MISLECISFSNKENLSHRKKKAPIGRSSSTTLTQKKTHPIEIKSRSSYQDSPRKKLKSPIGRRKTRVGRWSSSYPPRINRTRSGITTSSNKNNSHNTFEISQFNHSHTFFFFISCSRSLTASLRLSPNCIENSPEEGVSHCGRCAHTRISSSSSIAGGEDKTHARLC